MLRANVSVAESGPIFSTRTEFLINNFEIMFQYSKLSRGQPSASFQDSRSQRAMKNCSVRCFRVSSPGAAAAAETAALGRCSLEIRNDTYFLLVRFHYGVVDRHLHDGVTHTWDPVPEGAA